MSKTLHIQDLEFDQDPRWPNARAPLRHLPRMMNPRAERTSGGEWLAGYYDGSDRHLLMFPSQDAAEDWLNRQHKQMCEEAYLTLSQWLLDGAVEARLDAEFENAFIRQLDIHKEDLARFQADVVGMAPQIAKARSACEDKPHDGAEAWKRQFKEMQDSVLPRAPSQEIGGDGTVQRKLAETAGAIYRAMQREDIKYVNACICTWLQDTLDRELQPGVRSPEATCVTEHIADKLRVEFKYEAELSK